MARIINISQQNDVFTAVMAVLLPELLRAVSKKPDRICYAPKCIVMFA